MTGGREKKSAAAMQPAGLGSKKNDSSLERAAVGAIDVEAKVTVYVVLACTIAASGGLLFGEIGSTYYLCTATPT